MPSKPVPDEIEHQLTEWGQRHAQLKSRLEEHERPRDQMVRAAYSAGVPINRIHVLTGLSRPTLYRIIDRTR